MLSDCRFCFCFHNVGIALFVCCELIQHVLLSLLYTTWSENVSLLNVSFTVDDDLIKQQRMIMGPAHGDRHGASHKLHRALISVAVDFRVIV